jgi:twitching motility protein PilT
MINEIMGSNLRTRETLLLGENENRSYAEIIEASNTYGWHTFDQALVDAYQKELISEESAMIFSTSRSKVSHGLDRVKKTDNRTSERSEPEISLKLSA